MNQRVAEIRAEHWRNTVYECINRDQAISKRQWCKERGVSIRSLMYWQHKLQLEVIDRMDGHHVSLPNKLNADPPALVDISDQLEALQGGKPNPSGMGAEALTPELMIQAGSYQIYVNGSIQKNTLETVMKVLSHA